MAPVVNHAPTMLQMPPLSAADKYKSYVRSSSNPSHQFDDNMKEPNNNNPDFKNPNINDNNNQNNTKSFNDDAPQFFTCYTSYSCTPTDIPAVQSNQNITESSQKPVQANQGKPLINHLNQIESGKSGQNAPLNSINTTPLAPQTPQLKPMESFCHSSQMNQTAQSNILKNAECGKPAPHAQLNNMKNAPINPSPLITINDGTPVQLLQQRKTSNPSVGDRPQGQYGLAHSRSSPAVSSKGSSPSQNKSLVQHYFQNPHTYKNPKEKQLPDQGLVPKSMLPPPASPAARSQSTSPRNSFTEKRSSVPNAKSGDGNSNDWEKVLTKFYQW